MDHMKCALVQLALAKQHKYCTFVNRFKFFETYITAAIPYIRDIINSGHNVRVKNVLQASLLQKCLRRDSNYTFLATALAILLI